MRSEDEGLTRCEKHGLSFDARQARGCVLCRREAQAETGSRGNAWYALTGVALLVSLGVFGWIYLKPLLSPDRSAHESFVGLSPNSPGRVASSGERTPAADSGTAAAHAHDEPVPAATEAKLYGRDSALWTEAARPFQRYDSSDPSVQQLEHGFGIHVYVPSAPQLDVEQGKLIGTRPTPAQIATAARQLGDALARYPRQFVANMGLEQLVLIDGLRHRGQTVGAFAMGPAFALFADPDALGVADTLHHELFHCVDYRLHGRPANHSAWVALQQPGPSYRGARALLQQSGATAARMHALRRDLPGFVTEYAQADSAEDMAETFAQLVLHRAELSLLTSADPIIAAKVRYVLEALDRIGAGTSVALGF